METKNIEYIRTDVANISINPICSDEDGKKAPKVVGHVITMEDGKTAIGTMRTRSSIFANIGVSPNIETLFSLEEVFGRAISRGVIRKDITICLENNGSQTIAHAATFKSEFIKIDEVKACIEEADPEAELTFSGGIVRSTHPARDAESSFSIGDLKFSGGFVVSVPIDGYGDPVTYLKMYVNGKGVVLESSAFKSKIAMGSIGVKAITNNIRGYRNPEGFEALRGQLELADVSWVSVAEALGLHGILIKAEWNDPDNAKTAMLMDSFNRSLGRWRGYLSDIVRNNIDDDEKADEVVMTSGLSSLIFIPEKERRSLPLDASVLDLFTFACNARTNYDLTESTKRKIDSYIGMLLSSRYDLAGQKKKITTYDQFFE